MEQNQLNHATIPEVLDPLPVCNHIYPKGRHCRQAVASFGHLFCATHTVRQPAAAPFNDPLGELAGQLGSASEIAEVRSFISRVIRLACQNRISVRRATALTYMANSLLNAIRLANYEAHLASRRENNQPLEIDWTRHFCGDPTLENRKETPAEHTSIPSGAK